NLESELDDSYQSGNIMITETTRGLSVTLSNLHFQPDLAVLLSEDRPLLDELANILSGIPGRTVLVRGHTADVGRPEDQYNLSEERAKAVADELSLRGIDPRRLIYEGIGADEPLASNDSEAGRRRNRRVELVILED
ncbi:MAG: OmpA family protein, partial [Spirochaetaceae bacterium]|nr:OmpA family protein [Spirochaetaceae bacterium]